MFIGSFQCNCTLCVLYPMYWFSYTLCIQFSVLPIYVTLQLGLVFVLLYLAWADIMGQAGVLIISVLKTKLAVFYYIPLFVLFSIVFLFMLSVCVQ